MGRSVFFEDIVQKLPFRKDFQHLLDHVKIGDQIEILEVDKNPPPKDLYSRPKLERSCSSYGKTEIYIPRTHDIYDVIDIEDYSFSTPQQQTPFYYKVWCVQPLNNSDYICTWVLRQDGEILNIENFTSRGHVRSFQHRPALPFSHQY